MTTTDERDSQRSLPPGTMIQEYRLTKVVGQGSFGIVYVAENTYLPETVAIKEFLPDELADRVEGSRVIPKSDDMKEMYEEVLKKFLMEARTLYELAQPLPHRNIIRVMRYIEANGTGYMVMDYEQGEPLADKLQNEPHTLPEKELRALLFPLLDGLERVHNANVIHRDIKPDNILIRDDGSPVLIDFGAARRRRPDGEKSQFPVFTPNYAAPEQYYDLGEQGRWTDIYGLGATLYRAVTGHVPTNAAERLRGKAYQSAAETAGADYTAAFLAAIDVALSLQPPDRPQSIAEWRTLFKGEPDDATVVYSGPPGSPLPQSDAFARVGSPPPKPGRRLHPLLVAAAALGLAAVAVIAVLIWSNYETDTAPASTPDPGTEPAIDVATIRLDLASRASAYECAQIETRVDETGLVHLNGFVASRFDLSRLGSEVSAIPGVNEIRSDVVIHPEPFCHVIKLLASFQALDGNDAEKILLQTNKPGNDFKQGERLIVYTRTTSAFPGYFYVDAFNSYGEVLHMLPSPIAPENQVDARQQVTLGDQPCPACYETSPPHGRSLIVAISSTDRLFFTERPEFEDQSGYLSALRKSLQRLHAEGGKITSALAYITTHE